MEEEEDTCKEMENFYSSPSGVRMIKSRTMRWKERVARRRGKDLNFSWKPSQEEHFVQTW
jgi:hypothetical protein